MSYQYEILFEALFSQNLPTTIFVPSVSRKEQVSKTFSKIPESVQATHFGFSGSGEKKETRGSVANSL
jgi:hypothetical protein